MTLLERYWSKVAKGDGCWEWIGARKSGPFPYGLYRLDGRWVRAHRVSYEDAIGPIPPGLNVCHKCDNPPCVRPDHLFVGTTLDNVRDKIAKGRDFTPFRGQVQRGELNRAAKLTENDVSAIRAAVAAGERQKDIAARYGMDRANVSQIVRGFSWKHV